MTLDFALAAFNGAAGALASGATDLTSVPCENDLAAVGTTPAAIQAAAENVNFQNAVNSTVTFASVYAGAANPLVAQNAPAGTLGEAILANPTGTVAFADLGGNNVYINGYLAYGLMTGHFMEAGGGIFDVTSVLIHELIHNVTGLTDPDIQRDLGLSTDGVSDNISQKILTDCVH